jgi:hypothetical protein
MTQHVVVAKPGDGARAFARNFASGARQGGNLQLMDIFVLMTAASWKKWWGGAAKRRHRHGAMRPVEAEAQRYRCDAMVFNGPQGVKFKKHT